MAEVYTEEEALAKRCPLRTDSFGGLSPCLGSGCMKWEWFYKQIPSHTPKGFLPPPNMTRTDKGSCGL